VNCTRCNGTGFLNLDDLPEDINPDNREEVLRFIGHPDNGGHDCMVCDCCGNGSEWHGEPCQHYGPEDPQGQNGPYARNGGLAECH